MKKPQNPHWNVKDIGIMIDQIANKNLFGAYGVNVSNELTNILRKYMIGNIKDKHVLVIGSRLPWIEAILVYLG